MSSIIASCKQKLTKLVKIIIECIQLVLSVGKSRYFLRYTPTGPFTTTSVSVKIYVRTDIATLNEQKV
jgi:hypothetical protein